MTPAWARLIAAAAVLSAALAGLVWRHHDQTSRGRPVVVLAQGYDPRALLLGHYAQVQILPGTLALADADAARLAGAPRPWLRLAPGGRPGAWRPVGVATRRPALAAGEIAVRVRGLADAGAAPGGRALLRIDWGADRLYLPQRQAEALERRLRAPGAQVLVQATILPDGRLALSALSPPP